MIMPDGVMRIVAALRRASNFAIFPPRAYMDLLIGLREAERHYHLRSSYSRRVTWQGAAQLKRLRAALTHPAMPAGLVNDLATLRGRIDDAIAVAPEKPRHKAAKGKRHKRTTPQGLLIAQDLPRTWRRLTGEWPTVARVSDTSRVYEGPFVTFVHAVRREMGLKAIGSSTIVREFERYGVRNKRKRRHTAKTK